MDLFGFALYLAQDGKKHEQAKALSGFGAADVLEVVGNWNRGTYRAVDTVRLAEGVFVLRVFQKKSKRGVATPKADIDLIHERLKAAKQMAKERWVRDIKVGLPQNPQQNCKNPSVRLRKTHLAATRRAGVVIGRVGLALRPSASGRRHPRIIRLRQQLHFHVAHPGEIR